MTDLSHFDSNGPSNPKNNIFGLPFTEDDARLVILPIPWEVTVSYGAGTSRSCEHVFHASMQVDLQKSYESFVYSHASIMYNALQEIPQLKRLVQVGVRDYSSSEWEYIQNSNYQVITYFDKDIKERAYEGQSWKQIAEEIVSHLPEKVYISFDIDGLDPKLCPNTGTPVPGGFETEQMFYLIRRIIQSGRKFIGFDLVEIGVGDTDWDSNVGARVLWKLSNLLGASNS